MDTLNPILESVAIGSINLMEYVHRCPVGGVAKKRVFALVTDI
jgi:hypothetical protein